MSRHANTSVWCAASLILTGLDAPLRYALLALVIASGWLVIEWRREAR